MKHRVKRRVKRIALCSVRGAIVLAGCFALAGCGFHFAGQQPLADPLKSVYIQVIDPFHVTVPPLETALQARITRSGGVVKSRARDATSVLRLSNLQETQEVLSIGPDGKAIEYRLVSRATYELRSGTRELIPPQAQGLDRAYSFSATQILPKEAEEARLSRYVQDDLAEVILLRIQAQLRKHPNGIAEDEVPDALPVAAESTATPAVAGSGGVTPSAVAPAASTGAAPAP
ncbi:MAG: hypothetical protein JWR16_1496 [Nevskia sp.]|nr:hypothetical protein [Nevskia sp.]